MTCGSGVIFPHSLHSQGSNVFITPTVCTQLPWCYNQDKASCTPQAFSCQKYFANPQISAGFWGWMALICQTEEEQLEGAARLIWRWKGLCPAPKGADDAQAGVYLVSCFIYKTHSATISLQQQNLWILPVPLRNVARSSGLAAAPEPPASPWGSPRTQTLCRIGMTPHSQPASSRIPAGDFLTLFSLVYPARQSQALISTKPMVSQS